MSDLNQSSYYTEIFNERPIDIDAYFAATWPGQMDTIDTLNSDIYIASFTRIDRQFATEDVVVDGNIIAASARDYQGSIMIGMNTELHEIILGGDHQDALYGRDGDDLLKGGDGSDFLSGGDGKDTLIGGQGMDTLFGGDGDDEIHVDQLFAIYQTEFRDRDLDIVDGGAGDDDIYLSLQSDFVYKSFDKDSGLDTIFNLRTNIDRELFTSWDTLIFDTSTIENIDQSILDISYREANSDGNWVNDYNLLESDDLEVKFSLREADLSESRQRIVRDEVGVQFTLAREDLDDLKHVVLINEDIRMSTEHGTYLASELGFQVHDFQTPVTASDFDALLCI